MHGVYACNVPVESRAAVRLVGLGARVGADGASARVRFRLVGVVRVLVVVKRMDLWQGVWS